MKISTASNREVIRPGALPSRSPLEPLGHQLTYPLELAFTSGSKAAATDLLQHFKPRGHRRQLDGAHSGSQKTMAAQSAPCAEREAISGQSPSCKVSHAALQATTLLRTGIKQTGRFW
ncbi:hypothetical protein AB4099_08645 [Bosea sp. 2KB_26]|uniref:hypothetical protein n=1 Tax=Bosea sp. 2KB_26 TaxID=3237475 RepID=UPI003F93789C